MKNTIRINAGSARSQRINSTPHTAGRNGGYTCIISVPALRLLERSKPPVKTEALNDFSKCEHVDPHAHTIVTSNRLSILYATAAGMT